MQYFEVHCHTLSTGHDEIVETSFDTQLDAEGMVDWLQHFDKSADHVYDVHEVI